MCTQKPKVFCQPAEKQKENEKLRESLCKRQHTVESLRKDHERIKEENEKLQGKVERQQEENEHLTLEVYSMRNELNRYGSRGSGGPHSLFWDPGTSRQASEAKCREERYDVPKLLPFVNVDICVSI